MVTIDQSAPEAIGQALRPLQTSDHRRHIDVTLTGNGFFGLFDFIYEGRHAFVWFIIFHR
jgi:hypothetical protein